jgi:hypothetical protein
MLSTNSNSTCYYMPLRPSASPHSHTQTPHTPLSSRVSDDSEPAAEPDSVPDSVPDSSPEPSSSDPPACVSPQSLTPRTRAIVRTAHHAWASPMFNALVKMSPGRGAAQDGHILGSNGRRDSGLHLLLRPSLQTRSYFRDRTARVTASVRIKPENGAPSFLLSPRRRRGACVAH